MTDLKDKPGYQNPLVDESGVVKGSHVPQSPEVANHERGVLENNHGLPPASQEDIDANQPDHKRPDDLAPSMNDITASALASVTKGKFLGKFKFTKKQKAGGVGLFVGLMLVLIVFIVSGPLEALHLAQTLTGFHLTPRANQSSIRISKMLRHARYNAADSGRAKASTRLSLTGKIFAAKAEAKINKNGFKSSYSPEGRFVGYEITTDARQGLSDADIERQYGGKVEVDEQGRRFLVSKDGIRYRDTALTRRVLNGTSYGPITSAMQARFLSKMGLMDFHPIQKLKLKAGENINAKLADWKENRRGRLKGTIGFLLNGGQPISTKANSFVKSPTGKAVTKALGWVALTGVYCMASDLLKTVYESHLTEVVEPMIRTGDELMATGSQIQSGDDIDLATLGAFTENMRSKDYGDAMNAKSIKAQQGEGNDNKGTPLPEDASLTVTGLVDTLHSYMSAFETVFLQSSPAVISGRVTKENIRDTLCSVPVQAAIALASGALAIVSGSATQDLYLIARTAFQSAITAWGIGEAGDQLGFETLDPSKYYGGQFGAIADAGAFAGSNMIGVRSAGRQLKTPELQAIKEIQRATEQEENATRSIADKYLNPIKPDTFVAKIMDNQSVNVSSNVANLPTSFLDSMSSGFTNIASIFSPKLRAATPNGPIEPYDYGIPYVGFSQAEIEDPAFEDPFTNAEKATTILEGPKGEEIKGILSDCNKLEVQNDLSSTFTGESSIQYEGPDGIEEGYGGKCDNNDSDILSVRIAVYDTQIGEAMACYEGDEESCTTLGIANTETAKADCPPGTTSDPSSTGIAGKMYWPLEEFDKNLSDSAHDLNATIGTPVHAITDGTVVKSEDWPGCDQASHSEKRYCNDGMYSYGRIISIDHGGKIGTVNYAHFSKRMVEKGDKVVAGQIIGLSGNAGNSSGPHLHIDNNGKAGAIKALKDLNAEKPPKTVDVDNASPSCSTGTPGVYKDPLRDGEGVVRERVDAGVDYYVKPGSSIYALGNATILFESNSTGWPGGGFISYKLEDGPAKGLNVYFSEYCTSKVKKGDKVTSDTVICTINGSGQTETGWASGDGGTSASSGSGCYVRNTEDDWGRNFNDFLKSNKFTSGVLHDASNNSSCKVPAKYPAWK